MTNPSASCQSDLVKPITSFSLRTNRWGKDVRRILEAALASVDPGSATRRFLLRRGDWLGIAGRDYDLTRVRQLVCIALGKASLPMSRAAISILGDRLEWGIVVSHNLPKKPSTDSDDRDFSYRHSHLSAAFNKKVTFIQAGHPVPDFHSLHAAALISKLLNNLEPDDLVLLLLSGGGSALLASPAPGIELEDLISLTSALLGCGAGIAEINTLRKHLETLKGGGLARLAYPARLETLVLSDVIGDPLDMIASGPAVADPTSFSEAWEVLQRYQISNQASPAILSRLSKGMNGTIPETPKPGDPIFANVHTTVIGNNRKAALSAIDRAIQLGYHSTFIAEPMSGEARIEGIHLAERLRQLVAPKSNLLRPACLVAGGETTVKVRGAGKGGRNQEMALATVTELAGLSEVAFLTLATDGTDGPTDAAGAVITGETLSRAIQAGLDPHQSLEDNDSYHFFDLLDDLLHTGPTHTNVNDLAFLFAF